MAHKRSKSLPQITANEEPPRHLRYLPVKPAQASPSNEDSLKHEILELEKRLKDQFRVRSALENALGYKYANIATRSESAINKPAGELIKEIAVLEVEVLRLEQYLLSLYRKVFDQRMKSSETKSRDDEKDEDCIDSAVFRSHSSLSHCSVPKPDSPRNESLRLCFSQPLTVADHLESRFFCGALDSPNAISQEMVKCISTIYYKLSDPPDSSPISSFSSRNPNCSSHNSSNSEFTLPCIIEVQQLNKDNDKVIEVEFLLKSFRSLVSRLEDIDLKPLKRGENLAFWVNIHNSLVMHTYLAFGIPRNNIKRLFLLSKASYTIAGQSFSAETIQRSILKCRTLTGTAAQWIRTLIPAKSNHSHAIREREPLLHFALATGSHSDPAVRVYTGKRVTEEMVYAKEEYVRGRVQMIKETIVVPRIVEVYGKDCGMSQNDVVEMVLGFLPDSVKKPVKIEWMPSNFSFRYLISSDIVR